MSFAQVELQKGHMRDGADEEEKDEDRGNRNVNASGWEATSKLVPWEIWSARSSTTAAYGLCQTHQCIEAQHPLRREGCDSIETLNAHR